MARVLVSRRFAKTVANLDGTARDRVLTAIGKLERDPSMPGLNLEKLAGHTNRWSIRVNQGDRILLSRQTDGEGEYWLAEDVGPHDLYRRL